MSNERVDYSQFVLQAAEDYKKRGMFNRYGILKDAAAELAALTARLAQAERELAFFRKQFPTAAKRWQEAVEKEQQP